MKSDGKCLQGTMVERGPEEEVKGSSVVKSFLAIKNHPKDLSLAQEL